jgi:uncharacterized RDD family membrane protein YckC
MSTDEPGPGPDPFRKPDPTSGEGPPAYPGGQGGEQGGGGPYTQGPYATNPYGDSTGAADPLAGMPPLASLGRRLLARIVDGLIIAIPVMLIAGAVQGWDWNEDNEMPWRQLAFVLGYLVYEGLMLTASGQTVGKRLLKIKVLMLADGAIPAGASGWARAAVYNLPPLVPCIGFVFWIANVLFCTWDKPYRQCLHDKAAKTVVVSTE